MKNKESGFLTWLAFLILGIVMFVISLDDLSFILKGERIDVNETIVKGEEIKNGDNVSIDVKYVIDWYAELTQTGRRTGRKVTYHCLVLLDDGRIISMSVKQYSDEYRQIEGLIDDTYEYLMGNTDTPPSPIKFTGRIRKIDSEISEYYISALNMIGYTTGDYINLEIDTQQKRIYSILTFVFSVIIILLTIVFAYFWIMSLKEKKAERIRELNNINSVPKTENDPIFNKAFYDRMDSITKDSNDSDSDKHDVLSDCNTETKIEDSDIQKESKFSLKREE